MRWSVIILLLLVSAFLSFFAEMNVAVVVVMLLSFITAVGLLVLATFFPRKKAPVEDDKREVFVADTEAGKRFLAIQSGKCPACKKRTEFISGPSGGLSQNIFCNACGQGFNVTDMIGIADVIQKRTDLIGAITKDNERRTFG